MREPDHLPYIFQINYLLHWFTTILYYGRWNLVAGRGSCHTNILEIYYCQPQSAITKFLGFTLNCRTNILELPTALYPYTGAYTKVDSQHV